MKLCHLFFFGLFIISIHSSFISGPSPRKSELKKKPLKVLVISDLNSSYGSTTYSEEVTAVISKLDSIKPDIILCAGDMVAGQKRSLTETEIQSMWTSFDENVLSPINKLKIPFGFTVGNHDASPSFKLDRELAQQFWKTNAAETNLSFVDSTHYPFYFSYVKNNVFFLSWDASGSQVPREVYDWMKGQLKSKIARKARLRILLGHLPLYPIVESKNKPGELIASADSALLFMKDHRIDLYISGHQHAYYPATKNGVRLLNAGAIGDGPRKIMGHTAEPKKAYTIFEVPVRSAKKFTYRTQVPISHEIIEKASLPDSVTGINGVLHREK
ncbi:MAG TPA: metallophosphoesterase [Sphingobacteriaceae bacterium]